ncbi:tetrahydromethanopterin S-methyltransferase subunit MtrC [Methanobacterium alcaliphilum]|uniref:tetrahydromethanopterin S-methyltransferase subunit MtrC n=1 Tax=Methanobacterium alcaliphilum TaxID=392018 RepID=UPI00200AF78A|nr:tetrahydromethanopterin S-methyltransferase subunit C [Methanobacterium alcaliphilum]MCK9152513.1 tetrahydromethanopterin S-methyltransferase subunit C [Methanobacterium alcaliphilum]
MSVAGGGPAGAAISPTKTLALGVLGGLIGIYATPINPVIGPLLASLGAVCAIIWGADAIRRVASYGLGTGVPSIGYMSLAIGIIGAVGGLAGALIPGVPVIVGPVLGLVLAMILGLIVALLGKKIIKMKIPVLERCTAELSGAAALSVLGFSAAIAGTYSMQAILTTVIATGYIGLLFIMNTMAIQHPFNACLGPNENQVRTLKLAASTGFLAMAIVGLLGIGMSATWWVVSLIGALAWFIAIRAYISASFEEAASVKWAGLWPKEEEH